MTFAAVVPVAFFTGEHLSMTSAFLDAVLREPTVEAMVVYHNGGDLAGHGWRILTEKQQCPMGQALSLRKAEGWPFYRMWNDGIRWAHRRGFEAVAVLNNDITWPRGTLHDLANALLKGPPDLAVVSPDYLAELPRGELAYGSGLFRTGGMAGWCFVIRSDVFGKIRPIDERYQVWYGDDELALKIQRAGLKSARLGGAFVAHSVEATMRYRPNVVELRNADRRLFVSKYGPMP